MSAHYIEVGRDEIDYVDSVRDRFVFVSSRKALLVAGDQSLILDELPLVEVSAKPEDAELYSLAEFVFGQISKKNH